MEFTSWNPNELAHYGVLGMKWGQRRYQNKDGSLTAAGQRHYEKTGEYGYHYKSHATKKYARKAAKQFANMNKQANKLLETSGTPKQAATVAKMRKAALKSKKYAERAKRSAELDAREQEYAKSLSTGKALALTLLTSANTLKGYAQHRAMSNQSGNNVTGHKIVAGILSYYSGTYGSRIRKANYIRQGETDRKGLGKALGNLDEKINNKASNAIDTVLGTGKNKRRR